MLCVFLLLWWNLVDAWVINPTAICRLTEAFVAAVGMADVFFILIFVHLFFLLMALINSELEICCQFLQRIFCLLRINILHSAPLKECFGFSYLWHLFLWNNFLLGENKFFREKRVLLYTFEEKRKRRTQICKIQN